ncbi:calcium-responsive transactivator-like [Corticium candelabrum]|uniref:calcium-responsive transactivator-like n=1 Tax=Corticium candelabrum TaxID=121492 RepID=UPI002E26BB1C|nr:calcium-responsive transactivator-like [Corticium candelabrum]
MTHSFTSRRCLPDGVSQQEVQRLLDQNMQLIQAIVDYQNKGRAHECAQYQQLLHKNLVYLASLADSVSSKPEQNPSASTGVLVQTPVDGIGTQVGANAAATYGRRPSAEGVSVGNQPLHGHPLPGQQLSGGIHQSQTLAPPLPRQSPIQSPTSATFSHPVSHITTGYPNQQSPMQGQPRPVVATTATNQFMTFQRHVPITTYSEQVARQSSYTPPTQPMYASQSQGNQSAQLPYSPQAQHSPSNFQTMAQQLPAQQRYPSQYSAASPLTQRDNAGVHAQQQQQQPLDQRFLAPQQNMPTAGPFFGTADQSQLLPP